MNVQSGSDTFLFLALAVMVVVFGWVVRTLAQEWRDRKKRALDEVFRRARTRSGGWEEYVDRPLSGAVGKGRRNWDAQS